MPSAAVEIKNLSRPYVRLATPDAQYLKGESVEVLVHPPNAALYDFRIIQIGKGEAVRQKQTSNHLVLKKGLDLGRFEISVRFALDICDTSQNFSDWSMRLALDVHDENQARKIQQKREWEHRLSLIVDRDVNGVGMMNNPLAFPPSYPVGEQTCWFRAPVYEGSPTLINECSDFYRDPKSYFLGSIKRLVDRGFGFITWHDLIDSKSNKVEKCAIIQFDVDGGPNSMIRLIDPLIKLGVCGSIMIHNQANDWYEYNIQDIDLDALKRAETAGWCIGYHNNALNNVQRLDRLGDYSNEVLAEATECFIADVDSLRQHFDIRTFTNHGGNVLNHRLDAPSQANVICVDRLNAELWKPITTMFSDGGFTARPAPLGQRVEKLEAGLHFLRIHPVKYANCYEPWDFPPLVIDDAIQRGVQSTPQLKTWISNETNKQNRWLEHRIQHRLQGRFSHAGPDKAISRNFQSTPDIEKLITNHRSQRKAVFAREYPAAEGDPRVFWWRVLNTYAPKQGEILNVGALPHDRRKETTDFLLQDVKVTEMDIDPTREPHILGDITEPPDQLQKRFTGVFLMGLAYVHSPRKAIDACYNLVKEDGVGLFGFPDDTHPRRGAMWDPIHRPIWRRHLEPLDNIGLKGNLWSFDPNCLSDLFESWQDVVIENFSQYWFIVCRRKLPR